MPDMNGYEVCAGIINSSKFSDTHIAFISGVSQDEGPDQGDIVDEDGDDEGLASFRL